MGCEVVIGFPSRGDGPLSRPQCGKACPVSADLRRIPGVRQVPVKA